MVSTERYQYMVDASLKPFIRATNCNFDNFVIEGVKLALQNRFKIPKICVYFASHPGNCFAHRLSPSTANVYIDPLYFEPSLIDSEFEGRIVYAIAHELAHISISRKTTTFEFVAMEGITGALADISQDENSRYGNQIRQITEDCIVDSKLCNSQQEFDNFLLNQISSDDVDISTIKSSKIIDRRFVVAFLNNLRRGVVAEIALQKLKLTGKSKFFAHKFKNHSSSSLTRKIHPTSFNSFMRAKRELISSCLTKKYPSLDKIYQSLKFLRKY